jgi:hypothetical protein
MVSVSLPCRFNICPPQCWSPDIELEVRPRPSAGPGAGRFVRRPGPRAGGVETPTLHTYAKRGRRCGVPGGCCWTMAGAARRQRVGWFRSARDLMRAANRLTRRVAGSAATSFRRALFLVSAGARQSRRDRRHPTTNTMAPADAMRAATVSGIVRRSSMGPLHWRAFLSVFPGLQLRLVCGPPWRGWGGGGATANLTELILA